MKSKYHNEIKIINYIASTEKYKGIFFSSLLLSLYGGLILGQSAHNFFDSILNNISACSILKKDFSFYIIRLKNKKEYIKLIIRVTILMYLFHIFIILLFIFMIFLLTTFNDLNISIYQNYAISNFTYSFFYLIRYILLGMLLTLIFSLIYINTNDKIILTLQSLFLILIMYFDKFKLEPRTTFSLSIWSYFRNVIYETFSLEVTSSIFMVLILEIIIILLYQLSLKNKKVEIT